MNARLRAAALVLVALAAPGPVAAEWDPFGAPADEPALDADVSGLLYSRFNADLRADRTHENLQELRSKAWLELYVAQPGRWRTVASGLLRHDYVPDPGDTVLTPELWEAYGAWENPRWELVVGQQIRRWGRGVPSILDVLNPADLSEFLFVEDEFQKLPVPMARWTRFGERYQLELVAVPFYRGARLAGNDSDWSPISVRDLEGAEEIPLVEQAIEENIQPGIVTTPSDNLLGADVGLRYSPRVAGMDLDLIVFWGQEDLPAPKFSEHFRRFLVQEAALGTPPTETLRNLSVQDIAAFNPLFYQEPERQLMLGLGLARPIGGITARGELLLVSAANAYNTALQRLHVPSVQAALGVDALSSERFLYSLTLASTSFLTDEDLFLINRFNLSLSGAMRAKPFDVGLWLEVRGLWNVNLGDAWIGPALLYDVAEGLQLQAGVNLLGGPEPTPLSQLEENDFAWVRVRYVF